MHKTILLLLFIIGFCFPCFAQTNTTETLTITTYYPAPYGVYRNLRLNPSVEPTTGVDRGVMFYNNSSDSLEVYTNSGWVNLTGGGGGGFWSTYRGNHIVNNNTGNVGIGLNASSGATQPQSLLTVINQSNSAPNYHRVVSFGKHDMDTGRMGFISFYIQPQNDGSYESETANIFVPENSVSSPNCYSRHLSLTANDPAGSIRFSVGGRSNANQEVMRLVRDSGTNERRVGIGTINPTQKLDVSGQVHASGDICTDANGGKCLSTASGGSGLSCVRRTATSTVNAVALCPAGYNVTGGGCTLSGYCERDRAESYPEPGQEGWHCHNGNCASYFPLTAYAICCK